VSHLPPVTKVACNECPWRREAAPGHLGPYGPEKWVDIAHSEAAIACHKTITVVNEDGEGDWEDPQIRQCFGAAQFRKNVFKSPRDPEVAATDSRDLDAFFAWGNEFIAHHQGES
jgi:hypothetical protein